MKGEYCVVQLDKSSQKSTSNLRDKGKKSDSEKTIFSLPFKDLLKYLEQKFDSVGNFSDEIIRYNIYITRGFDCSEIEELNKNIQREPIINLSDSMIFFPPSNSGNSSMAENHSFTSFTYQQPSTSSRP